MATLLYCFLVCIVVALVVSRLDARWRAAASNKMHAACGASGPELEVLLVGPPREASEDLSDALLSIFHQASCPKRVHVTMIEAVGALERESSTLIRYKEKCNARGHYNEAFLEQITAVQVLTGLCMFKEAAAYIASSPAKARVTLIADATTRLMSAWDVGLADAYDALPRASASGLYCGSVDGQPAYTAIERFSKKKTPVVVARPLLRATSALHSIWASVPFATNSAHVGPALAAAGACTSAELGLRLTHRVGLSFWTASKAIAERLPDDEADDALYWSYANPRLHETDALLGVYADKATPVEFVAKFGSLGNFQWAARR